MMSRPKATIRKLFFPRSLRYQLLTRILFILSFILLLIGSLQYFVMKDFLYKNEADILRANLLSLPRTMVIRSEKLPRDQEGRIINEENPSQRFLFMENFSLATITANGQFIDLLTGNGLPAPLLSEVGYSQLLAEFYRERNIKYKIVTDREGSKQLLIYRPLGSVPGTSLNAPEGFLQMGTSIEHLQDTLMQQLFSFIVLAVLALAAGVAMYFSVIRKTLTPLANIVDSVEKINAGNLSDRIPIQLGQEEVDRLSDSFNEMLERLEASFKYERETKERMRRFIADASHELRTPLTSIHGFLEVLLRGAANRPEQLYNALNSMHGESKRIIKLVEDLLLLAKLDRAPELQLADTKLTEMIYEMEPQLNVLAGTRSVTFAIQKNISGWFDSDKLKQVLLNLFQNAVQHTDSVTGKINLTLDSQDQSALLTIQDNGLGIDSKALPHVFDRFYRIDSSRARKNGGSGLGLAISKSIVEAHGGNIIVESNLGEGATFTVSLPLTK